MKRWLLLVAVGATMSTLATMMLGAVGMAYAQGARGVCVTEDSPSCVWIGPLQGEHPGGRIVVNGPERP